MIYLLEDDDSIRKLVIYALQSQGYEAAGFERPSEFWHAMGRRLPELVLLDVMLPEEDGLSVLKKLRSATATAAIPVIMLTAKNTEFDRVTGLDCGADDFVSKPFGMFAGSGGGFRFCILQTLPPFSLQTSVESADCNPLCPVLYYGSAVDRAKEMPVCIQNPAALI